MKISMKWVRWALLAAVYVTIVICAWPLPVLNYFGVIIGVCAVWTISSVHEFYKGLEFFEEYTKQYREFCMQHVWDIVETHDKMREMEGNDDGN